MVRVAKGYGILPNPAAVSQAQAVLPAATVDEVTPKGKRKAAKADFFGNQNNEPIAVLHSAASNNDVHTALNHISANSDNALHRLLADKLRSALPEGVKIGVVNSIKNSLGRDGFMNYNYVTKTVSVNKSHAKIGEVNQFEKGLLHELIHAATGDKVNAIVNESDVNKLSSHHQAIRQQLNTISRAISHHVAKQGMIGYEATLAKIATEKPSELITYGLTEPKFQKMLADVKIGKRTGWSEFVHTIAKLVGVPLNHETALSALLSTSDELLNGSDKTDDVEHIGHVAPRASVSRLHQAVASNDVHAALSHIERNSKSALHRLLVQKMRSTLPDNLNLSVVDSLKNKRGEEGVMNYDYGSKKVSINLAHPANRNAATFEKGLMHELVHAVTGEKINAIMQKAEARLSHDEKIVRNQLKLISKSIVHHVNVHNVQGGLRQVSDISTTNLRELITYGLTEPAFQKMLAEVRISKEKTAWQTFVHAIARLLGIPVNTETETALSTLFKAGERLLAPETQTNSSIFSPIAEQAEQFRKALSSLMTNLRSRPEPISIGKPSAVLSAVGVPDLPIIISKDAIKKATNGVKHVIPMSIVENLPEILANPVMVLNSRTEKNALVVLSEFKNDAGESIMIALHLGENTKKISVNRIASVYGKNDDNFFITDVRKGNARYINEEKAREWTQSSGLQLPREAFPRSSSKQNYITNHDLINKESNDDFIDFFTDEPRRAHSLSDIDTMLDTGKQPQNKVGLQHYFDKIVTNFTDFTRPFARFVQDTFAAEHASRLLSGADRALGMKAAYEKEAMGLFGNKVAKGIKAIVKSTQMDYKTAKDLAGYWLTARYAPDANQWLMQKDQDAINELMAEIAQTTDPAELAALNKKLAKAQTEQKQRVDAINDPAIIDPTQQKSEAGLAGGFNNATAASYLAKIEAKIPKVLLEAVANPIYEMNQWKLKRDIQDGKISQATADKFPKYAHYVPLTGDPRTDDSVDDHFATGGMNQAKDKALGGRTGSIAQNGIDASFEQLEKSARYHGWNDFKTALTDTYDSLIAEKIAKGLSQKEAEQAVWDEYHLKRRAENAMPAGENDITVRKDGKGFVYTINNQGAMQALRSVNDEPTPSVLKPIAFFTRLQARMVTQFMPLFAPTNMIRDVAERSENIRTRKIVGHEHLDMNKVANQAIANAGGLLLKIKPIMAGVLAENTHLAKLFPVDNNNADVTMLKRFLALGGSSTYGDMMSGDSKSLAEKLRKAGTLSSEAMEVVELWNNAFETISGFSIYKALVEKGVSEEKAATASLNLMNFRKRGRVMSPLRALYMFAQPIATGGHQMAMTLATRRGQVRYAAYTVASMFLYAILRAGDDDDELGINKMDEQGNSNLYRNILIPAGGGKYIKVPVGFGMQQLAWSHGVNAVRTMLGEMTAAEFVAESSALWARSAMPVAPSETAMWKNPAVWFAQTFSPQIAKPIVNIGLDVNSFGAPLTNARYERQDKAKSLQGRHGTPSIYKDIAQVLGRHGIDMYPEQVREVMRDYGAGVGNEVLKWAVENPAKEARGLETASPLIDRYLLQSNDDSLKQRLYYRARDRMNELNVRESTGDKLTPAEKRLADLGDQLKSREASQRGKMAAATKAEKAGQMEKAANLRAMADRMRVDYMDYALKQVR